MPKMSILMLLIIFVCALTSIMSKQRLEPKLTSADLWSMTIKRKLKKKEEKR